MRLSDEKFFLETLDLDIAELGQAAELYKSGDTMGACHVFVEYLRKNLGISEYMKHAGWSYEGLPDGVSYEEYCDMILDGYVYSVGKLYQYEGGRIIWDYNPTYNGYVEYGFHLNHHSEFFYLAKRYGETSDEKYAKRFASMIDSWITDHECPGKEYPDRARPTWRSIDSAYRMYASWPYAICSFISSPSVSDREWVDIFKSIWEHSYRLIGLNTKFNWHTSEIHGVVTSALLYPFFNESEDWYRWAVSEIRVQVDKEIYPDGMQAELSTGYQLGVISHFRHIEKMMIGFSKPVPEDIYKLYRLLISSYIKLVSATGTVEGINDSSAVNIKKVMKTALDIFPGDPVYRWFYTEGREGVPPEFTSVVLPYSGFAVMRTGWDKNDFFVLFDSGPEGTAHIHEDKLNVLLSAYGEDMLDDIGFYAYDTSDMRYFSVGTRSHNSGLVDGFGQNRSKTHRWGEGVDYLYTQTPAFGEYADVSLISDLEYERLENAEIASGTYRGGYGPDLIPAEHKRRVIFFNSGICGSKPFVLLCDRFRSLDYTERLFEVTFQHKAVPVRRIPFGTVTEYPSGTSLTTVSSVEPEIIVGAKEPRYVGWRPIHNPDEHEHEPAPFVSFAKKGVSAEFFTVLYPSDDKSGVDITMRIDSDKLYVTVDGKECPIDKALLG